VIKILRRSIVFSAGLACLAGLLLQGSDAATLKIHCINVGQGDCTLIESPTEFLDRHRVSML
jgi:beta-lactamase superfamily II metal-dependent hydrolase